MSSVDHPSTTSRRALCMIHPQALSHTLHSATTARRGSNSLSHEKSQVVTVTPCVKRTTEYKGTRVISVLGLQLPFYNSKTLLMGTGARPALTGHRWRRVRCEPTTPVPQRYNALPHPPYQRCVA